MPEDLLHAWLPRLNGPLGARAVTTTARCARARVEVVPCESYPCPARSRAKWAREREIDPASPDPRKPKKLRA